MTGLDGQRPTRSKRGGIVKCNKSQKAQQRSARPRGRNAIFAVSFHGGDQTRFVAHLSNLNNKDANRASEKLPVMR